MKRIMAFVVSVLLLVGLTACNQNVGRHADGIIKADKATIEIGSTHTAFDGMEIQIVNAVWNMAANGPVVLPLTILRSIQLDMNLNLA